MTTTHTMTTAHTISRGRARLRLAAAVAVPLLAFSVACGGGEGLRAEKAGHVTSVSDAPTAAGTATSSGAPGAPGASGASGASAEKARPSVFFAAQLTYVRCMRAKAGVTDFPDPRSSGYLDFSKIEKVIDPKGGGEEYKGGRNGVCLPELRKAMDLEPERDKKKDYASMLAHSACMRENGVPEFTDPVMSGGHVLPGGDPSPASPALDVESAVYQQARAACASELLDGLDGMQ
ncbi:hypothetical protein ACFVIM_25375 [Streptomyces sp. NPDC057638]|uniref:hypothetical protein n=1 Tax=Streptomyces sp. NPDC057638 TaxID=3346190 RepID=UPI0036B8E7AC